MDAVILAAGRGDRLNGIVPRYYKPLLVVNGRPIVASAVDAARHAGASRVIVVVSPDNAKPISEVLNGRDVLMIVQQDARGPGHALRLGAELCFSDKVLVLMGDNVLEQDEVLKVAEVHPYGIGVQKLAPTESAERFTRRRRRSTWVEKVPITDEDLYGVGENDVHVLAWIGPLTVSRDSILHCYTLFPGALIPREAPIGPYLDVLAPEAELVMVTTVDVGLPETVNGGSHT